MLHILKCPACKAYTLKKICSRCNGVCLTTKPAKFSLEDKYQKYRLAYKKGGIEYATQN